MHDPDLSHFLLLLLPSFYKRGPQIKTGRENVELYISISLAPIEICIMCEVFGSTI